MGNLLRNRDYVLLSSGQLLSRIGNSLYLLALPWYVYTLTHSKADLALVGFWESVPLIAGLFTGVLADRRPPRQVMIFSDMARMFIAAGIAAVAGIHGPLLWLILGVVLLELAGTIFRPAYAIVLPRMVGEERVSDAEGFEQSSSAIAQICAMLGGGVLMQLSSPFVLFTLDALSFVVSWASVLGTRVPVDEPPSPGQRPSASLWKLWIAGFRAAFIDRQVLLVILTAMAANFGFAPFDILMTAWVKGPMHGQAGALGIVSASFVVGLLIGGLLVGALASRLSPLVVVACGLVTSGILLGIFGQNTHIWWATSVLFLCGIAVAIMNGTLGTLFYRMIARELRGRVFGILGSLTTAMTPIGIAVFGGLMLILSLPITFLLVGLPSVMAGLALALLARTKTEKKGHPDDVLNASAP